jgi:hypothetical protein
MRRPKRRVPLDVTLLEGKVLSSSLDGHDSLPQAIQCLYKHMLDLNGRIEGSVASAGSTLQIVSSAGSVQDYGRVKAKGTFTFTPSGTINSGRIELISPHGRLNLTLMENSRWPVGRNGQSNLRYTIGRGTYHYGGHCSSGSVRVALNADRSHFVATLRTTS